MAKNMWAWSAWPKWARKTRLARQTARVRCLCLGSEMRVTRWLLTVALEVLGVPRELPDFDPELHVSLGDLRRTPDDT